MLPAIFLDRDGVVIENQANYVRAWEEVIFLPQALKALARVCLAPYKIFIVTNQSGIGRGVLPLERAVKINEGVVAEIVKNGGRIDAVYMCPHAPHEECTCRKPRPGMLLQAAQEHSIDLSRSIMIGDALSDVQAGLAAGVRQAALLRTGRGPAQLKLPQASALPPFRVYNDLEEALLHLIP